MRRTILLASVLALAVALASPASADEPIPVTCTVTSIQKGWDVNGKEADEYWIEVVDGEEWLVHHGTGYFLAVGDTYCRGRWDIDGGWRVSPVPDPGVWPPPEGSEMYFSGEFTVWLNHGPLRGSGFIFEYEGELLYDYARNRGWEWTVTYSEGFGPQLEGWAFSEDTVAYQHMFPPWGGEGPGFVFSGYVVPPDG